MMLSTVIPLVSFSLVATITPGGATTLATASGAQFGLFKSVALIAGLAMGLASLGAAAAIGLATLILSVPSAELVLRLVGSAYLLWLSYRIAMGGPPNTSSEMQEPIGIVGGALLLWLNPKAWATALGAAATFGNIASGPTELAVILAVVFGLAATLSLTLWCTAGAALAQLLRTNKQWRVVNTLLGIILALSIIRMWI